MTLSRRNTVGEAKTRTAAPSAAANNQDVFVWSLYLLGGADRDVDVEEIYLKAFELAPARLAWRTRPELPDYKKTSKALQSIEATTHVGLIHRPHKYARRLTAAGVAWIEKYKSQLSSLYSGARPVSGPATSEHERRRKRAHSSAAWQHWKLQSAFDLTDLADALECSTASPAEVWTGRIEELRRSAQVLGDDELAEFAAWVDEAVGHEIGGGI